MRGGRAGPALAVRLPRPRRIYYGWYIVFAAIAVQMVAVGLQSYSSGVFLKPMTHDLGWSREQYANGQTIGTFVMGGLGLYIGGLLDRQGARPLMIAGALVGGLSLIGMARIHSLREYYLLRGLAFAVGSVGMGNLVINVTISKWFVRNRGMAIALASAGVSLGGVVMTPVAQALVDRFGWREAFVILGVVLWLVIIPAVFAVRRTPEDHGLRPDGDPPGAPAVAPRHRNATVATEESWTRPEALRTAAIWLLIFAYGIANIGLGALLFHIIPFLEDNGFSANTAAFLFSIQAWAALISKPIWGALMNRLHARYLSSIAFVAAALTVIGLLATARGGSEPAVLVMLFAWGLAIGGSIPLQETIWASYFGRLHLGRIRAVAMPFTIIFSAIGPKFAAHLYDQTGSYVSAFLIFAAFWLLGAGLVLLARPPRRRIKHAPTAPAAEARLPAP